LAQACQSRFEGRAEPALAFFLTTSATRAALLLLIVLAPIHSRSFSPSERKWALAKVDA
jgi:hypothetical protein